MRRFGRWVQVPTWPRARRGFMVERLSRLMGTLRLDTRFVPGRAGQAGGGSGRPLTLGRPARIQSRRPVGATGVDTQAVAWMSAGDGCRAARVRVPCYLEAVPAPIQSRASSRGASPRSRRLLCAPVEAYGVVFSTGDVARAPDVVLAGGVRAMSYDARIRTSVSILTPNAFSIRNAIVPDKIGSTVEQRRQRRPQHAEHGHRPGGGQPQRLDHFRPDEGAGMRRV